MKNFWIVLALAAVVAAEDYCDESLCPGSKHVACGHDGKFHARCNKDAALYPIDEKLKQDILNQLNKNRNSIAGGGESGYKPACRMATMEWDDDLAKFAELNVKQCKGSHDCHSTKKYPYSNQNLNWIGYNGGNNHHESIVESVNDWYNEKKDSSARVIRNFMPDGKMTGHFLTVVLENNDRVGCAASTYKDDDSEWNSLLVACNFAASYYDGSTIYTDCDVPGKNCKNGMNPKYPNLCSQSEIFDRNHIYIK